MGEASAPNISIQRAGAADFGRYVIHHGRLQWVKAVTKSKDVNACIATQPPETQRALEELRSCIWKTAPGVSELMNYSIPAFALVGGGKRDKQIMIAGYTRHVGFYPNPKPLKIFAYQISMYKFAKGSIQFPLNKPMPEALVVEMVKYRLSQLQK